MTCCWKKGAEQKWPVTGGKEQSRGDLWLEGGEAESTCGWKKGAEVTCGWKKEEQQKWPVDRRKGESE